ncbi:MAG: glycoside hydrolase family 2 protein [Spirochaetia bacterium]
MHEVFGYFSFEIDGHDTRTNSFFLTEPKRCDLPVPGISAVVGTGSSGPTATLETDLPAFYVSLSLRDARARFSDNLLCLMPGTPAAVEIETALEPEEIGGALQVMNLAEMGNK